MTILDFEYYLSKHIILDNQFFYIPTSIDCQSLEKFGDWKPINNSLMSFLFNPIPYMITDTNISTLFNNSTINEMYSSLSTITSSTSGDSLIDTTLSYDMYDMQYNNQPLIYTMTEVDITKYQNFNQGLLDMIKINIDKVYYFDPNGTIEIVNKEIQKIIEILRDPYVTDYSSIPLNYNQLLTTVIYVLQIYNNQIIDIESLNIPEAYKAILMIAMNNQIHKLKEKEIKEFL